MQEKEPKDEQQQRLQEKAAWRQTQRINPRSFRPKIARNSACPCRSNRKFKTCCLPNLPLVVPETVAEEMKKQIDRGNVFFVTKENEGIKFTEDVVKHLGANQVQCEGCSRGDTPVLDDAAGFYWHAAPLVELPGIGPTRGKPFRCLKLARDAAIAQAND